MKVLFDATVLARALLDKNAVYRTGIFRYAENLARHLKEIEETTLMFHSSLDEAHYLQWQQQLLKMAYFNDVKTINHMHPLTSTMSFLTEKMKQASFFRKMVYKGLKESLRFFSAKTKTVQDFDVYYSPYHPTPSHILANKDLVCFTTIHDLIPLKYPKFFKVDKRKFFEKIFKNAGPNHFFLALSESTKADICHYFSVDPDKIFIAHSAPQNDLFYPVQDSMKLQKTLEGYGLLSPYILSLATLEPRKNISMLIDAYVQIITKNPQFPLKLVLCGAKGWGEERLEQKIAPYKDRIIVTGFVPDHDLAALYSGAKMFVYPSLYEGFGLPPLEAMRCKTPVIVSDRSSLPEVVKDAGLYIDPSNINDIIAQILKLSNSPELEKELIEKGALRAQEFSWQQNAFSVHSAFEKALAQAR